MRVDESNSVRVVRKIIISEVQHVEQNLKINC